MSGPGEEGLPSPKAAAAAETEAEAEASTPPASAARAPGVTNSPHPRNKQQQQQQHHHHPEDPIAHSSPAARARSQHHQTTSSTTAAAVPAPHNTTSVYHAAIPALSGAPVGGVAGLDFAAAADAPGHAHPPPAFAAPSSFLRPLRVASSRPTSSAGSASGTGGGGALLHAMGTMGKGPASSLVPRAETPLDREHRDALRAIRAFLKVRTSYDVLPLSFRLIIFDTALLVKKSLNILIQNGIVSAPLWDSSTSTFAGLLTTADYINIIQYYWQNPDAFAAIDRFQLNALPDVERAIGVQPLETVSIHPDRPLYEACRKMITSKARRIPLVDFDDETQRAMVVSVVTQYRILKFIAVNVQETGKLKKPLSQLRLGTYGVPGKDLAVAQMDTPVMDVIHMLVKRSISSVPILDKDGVVINVFEGVDVITLIKGGVYDDLLNLTVGDALLRRPDDFAGIYTCTVHDRLDTIFDTVRKSRVHRLVVIDEHNHLRGILSLSDILEYVLLEGEGEEE